MCGSDGVGLGDDGEAEGVRDEGGGGRGVGRNARRHGRLRLPAKLNTVQRVLGKSQPPAMMVLS